jgi:hypothetical protein
MVLLQQKDPAVTLEEAQGADGVCRRDPSSGEHPQGSRQRSVPAQRPPMDRPDRRGPPRVRL